MSFDVQQIKAGVSHLRKADVDLRQAIDRVGPFSLRLQSGGFATLLRSIVSQQISTAAARAIRKRLEALLAPGRPTPKKVSRLSEEQLRSVGLSAQKIRYVKDLAKKSLNGEVQYRSFRFMTDDQIIEQLVGVRGIGRWTAQMLLIFCLGRLNVFPYEDLGIRKGIQKIYAFDELPDKSTCLQVSAPWHPYCSVASWYCWRSLDLQGG